MVLPSIDTWKDCSKGEGELSNSGQLLTWPVQSRHKQLCWPARSGTVSNTSVAIHIIRLAPVATPSAVRLTHLVYFDVGIPTCMAKWCWQTLSTRVAPTFAPPRQGRCVRCRNDCAKLGCSMPSGRFVLIDRTMADRWLLRKR